MQEDELSKLSPRDREMAGIGQEETGGQVEKVIAELGLPTEVSLENLSQFEAAVSQLQEDQFRLEDAEGESTTNANASRIAQLRAAWKELNLRIRPFVAERQRSEHLARQKERAVSKETKTEVREAVFNLGRFEVDAIEDLPSWLKGDFIRHMKLEELESAQTAIAKLIKAKRSAR